MPQSHHLDLQIVSIHRQLAFLLPQIRTLAHQALGSCKRLQHQVLVCDGMFLFPPLI